jgi:hypothetical protein
MDATSMGYSLVDLWGYTRVIFVDPNLGASKTLLQMALIGAEGHLNFLVRTLQRDVEAEDIFRLYEYSWRNYSKKGMNWGFAAGQCGVSIYRAEHRMLQLSEQGIINLFAVYTKSGKVQYYRFRFPGMQVSVKALQLAAARLQLIDLISNTREFKSALQARATAPPVPA